MLSKVIGISIFRYLLIVRKFVTIALLLFFELLQKVRAAGIIGLTWNLNISAESVFWLLKRKVSNILI